jgi:hypothetical protein
MLAAHRLNRPVSNRNTSALTWRRIVQRIVLSSDKRVNAALDAIETELAVALNTTAQQLNDLLLTKPDDPEPVHQQLERVHRDLADIAGNHRRYTH